MSDDDDESELADDDPMVKRLAERLAFAAMSVFARVTYATIERQHRGETFGRYWIDLAKEVLRDRASGDHELAEGLGDAPPKPN